MGSFFKKMELEPMTGKARNVIFTCFDMDFKHALAANNPEIVFMVLQLERCPTSGRLHYQGYMELNDQYRNRKLQAICGVKMSFYDRKGTQQECITYCTKEETRVDGPWTYGTPKKSNKQASNISTLVSVSEQKGRRAAFEECPGLYARHYKLLDHLDSISDPPERPGTRIIVYHGEPGTGKSYEARHRFPGCAKIQDNVHGWFDGYVDQKVVLIDEFMCLMPLQIMLQLCEDTPMRVPVKGGFRIMRANTIVITTNKKPEELYPRSVAFRSRLDAYGEFHHKTSQMRGVNITPALETETLLSQD